MNLGISGRLTRATIKSPLTPLILLAAIAFGLIALMIIPREEEPQISVPMVDIFVQANGLKAADAAELVTKPLEEIVKGIAGVEHVYSQTQDDRVMVTARFLTGTNEDDAILRIHAKLRANFDRIPLGIPEPLIVGVFGELALVHEPRRLERTGRLALGVQLVERLLGEEAAERQQRLVHRAELADAQGRIRDAPATLRAAFARQRHLLDNLLQHVVREPDGLE